MGCAQYIGTAYVTTMLDPSTQAGRLYVWLAGYPNLGTWSLLPLPRTITETTRQRVEWWVEDFFKHDRRSKHPASWPELAEEWELVEVAEPSSFFDAPPQMRKVG